jgi:hypothetical protein
MSVASNKLLQLLGILCRIGLFQNKPELHDEHSNSLPTSKTLNGSHTRSALLSRSNEVIYPHSLVIADMSKRHPVLRKSIRRDDEELGGKECIYID